jgi:hypothetical protein
VAQTLDPKDQNNVQGQPPKVAGTAMTQDGPLEKNTVSLSQTFSEG